MIYIDREKEITFEAKGSEVIVSQIGDKIYRFFTNKKNDKKICVNSGNIIESF